MSEMGPEAMGTAAKVWHRCRCAKTDGGAPMTQVDDLSRSLITFEQNSTMVVVLEMSQSSWLAAGGFRGRPGWFLVSPLATRSQYRALCHPFDQRRSVTRASQGKDGSSRHRNAHSCVLRMAAW